MASGHSNSLVRASHDITCDIANQHWDGNIRRAELWQTRFDSWKQFFCLHGPFEIQPFLQPSLYNGTVYPVEYDAWLAVVVFEDCKWLRNIDPAAPFVFEIWVWKEAATWSQVFTGEIRMAEI
ncbi:arginine--tRNA ligase [Striga asiatica]|uniref:Arginine--tRNA ligase n=1 Tax=Striga asiatica TaxID=4170 RepID=A0A5A7NYT1_STRAF|nr:arginine--tRNA ligase [Striga asiatica]